MTIGFTRKVLVVGASVAMLALGAAPASFAGEDDGPTANGEQIGSTLNSSGGSSNGSSSGSSSGSSRSAVKSAQKHVSRTDTTQAVGAAQTGFGGMAATPTDNLLVTLLIGLGGAAAIAGARGLSPSNRRADR